MSTTLLFVLPLAGALAADPAEAATRVVPVQAQSLRVPSAGLADKSLRPSAGLSLPPRQQGMLAQLAADGSIVLRCGEDPFLPDLRFDRVQRPVVEVQ